MYLFLKYKTVTDKKIHILKINYQTVSINFIRKILKKLFVHQQILFHNQMHFKKYCILLNNNLNKNKNYL